MKLKVLSLFSGIGAFEKALDNLDIAYELVAYCEIDKYASKSYSAIHDVPESMNLGDITKVDEKALPKDIDLTTYGFPCQDISLAGKQKGLLQCEVCNTANSIPENFVKRLKNGEKFYCEKCGAELKQTRSGLFFEALRIIEETKPKVAIAENVKNLTGKKFKEQFQIVLDSLEEAGYNNYWKVLNAKDFGIPQNRERVFIVSIRKDVDTKEFYFPGSVELKNLLKDLLEEKVDGKYYLKETKNFFIKNSFAMEAKGNGFRFEPHVRKNAYIAKTITTRSGGRMDDNFIFDVESSQPTFKFDRSNDEAVEYAVQLHLFDDIEEAKCVEAGDLQHYQNEQMNRVYSIDGIAPTVLTKTGGGREIKVLDEKGIRKLTPKECFRLMGFDDADFEKAEAVNSNTQLYKQAGNSIVVPVIEYIIKALIDCKAFEPSIKIECEADSFKESIKAVEEEVQELAEVIELNDTENTAVKKKKVGIFASLIKEIARAKEDKPKEKQKHKII